jgi:hypothetical protein
MSVDLFFYASESPEKINQILKRVAIQFPEFLESKFIIYDAKTANTNYKKIALEHQFDAHSVFIVSLNDKSASNLVITIADKLKEAIGGNELIVLHTNETLI